MLLKDMLVPTYVQMLRVLSGWLDKTAAQLPAEDAEALLSARLAPDMFPLSTQIRFACVQAVEGVHRLKGADVPPLADVLQNEGVNGGEQPGTIAQAQARIAEVIAVVESLGPDLPDVDPQSPLAHTLPLGIIFDFTAGQYVRDWTIPQFYFHIMTAYAILRHSGLALGKADYMPHLFPYVRPGTMPEF